MIRIIDEPLIHIGYHKTASTSLQNNLFGAAGNGFLVPPDEPRHKLVERFVVPAPMTFDTEATREVYSGFLEQAAALDRVAVLSHERFSGYPPSGGYDSTIIAHRLKACFPEARILIVFREQLGSILSMYSQYITDGGDERMRDYLRPREPNLKRSPGFSLEFYRYDRLLQLYRKLFGPDRVLGLTYEDFIRTPDAFVGRIYDFLGRAPHPFENCRENSKRSNTFQAAQRLINRHLSENELSRRAALPISQIHRRFGRIGARIPQGLTAPVDSFLEGRMRRHLATVFDGAFADSNAALSGLIGSDLGALGYQMPG